MSAELITPHEASERAGVPIEDVMAWIRTKRLASVSAIRTEAWVEFCQEHGIIESSDQGSHEATEQTTGGKCATGSFPSLP